MSTSNKNLSFLFLGWQANAFLVYYQGFPIASIEAISDNEIAAYILNQNPYNPKTFQATEFQKALDWIEEELHKEWETQGTSQKDTILESLGYDPDNEEESQNIRKIFDFLYSPISLFKKDDPKDV